MANEFITSVLYGIKRFNEKKKEVVGMEKLISLLKEYISDKYVDKPKVSYFLNKDALIISREFGFVEWLLKNKKISPSKMDEELRNCAYINDELAGSWIKLTMLLSIKENPKLFLASILR